MAIGPLGNIPGLGGFLAQRQVEQQNALGGMQQVIGLINILRQQEEAQRLAQREPLERSLLEAQVRQAQERTEQSAALERTISNLPPEVQALARLNPRAFAEKALKGDESKVVPPGAAIIRGGQEVYRNPRQERDSRTQFEKLLDAAGVPPERRSELLQQYITKQTSSQPAVNVYSGSLTPGVDAQGNPIFVQPSSRPGVDPRIVPNVFPAPKPAPAGNNPMGIVSEYEAADEIIEKMMRGIQSGGRLGAVGIPGTASQVLETVRGTVDPKAPTPVIDLQSDKEMLLDKMKALATRKDSNLSNKDIERYERILGFDKALTTPGAAIRALTNVREDLRRRRINLAVPNNQVRRDQFEPGKEYTDARGNRAIYKGNGQWEPR